MQLKRRLAAVACAGTLAVVGAAPAALAHYQHVGGGHWDQGVNNWPGGDVWSNYLHTGRRHGSSVDGKYFDSDCASQDNWSRARAPSAGLGTTDYTWWRYC